MGYVQNEDLRIPSQMSADVVAAKCPLPKTLIFHIQLPNVSFPSELQAGTKKLNMSNSTKELLSTHLRALSSRVSRQTRDSKFSL